MSSNSLSTIGQQTFKIVLLGEGCVGKTSLVLRYCQNKFNENHQSTLQASYLEKQLNINGQRVNLSIWDTAGQERFHALGPIYYRDSNGAILVYDVTDADSLSKVKSWVKELRKMLGNSVVLVIVGNKIDLLPSNQQNNISSNELIAEAQSYSTTANATHFCTSAKLNRGIDQMFLELTKKMLQNHKSIQHQQQQQQHNQVGQTRSLRIADDSDNDSQTGQRTNKCNC